ncbi:MAG: transporter substrate-binding domain-containing protein [Desulfobacula sp.]|nr:transporter substrate-binding domain-containing protein [Desulfobacula sp.]
MRNFILSFFVVMIVICSLALSNVSAGQTVVFVVGEWSPFVSKDLDGNGPTAEIVALACKNAGLKAKFQFSKWNDAYELVKTGVVVGSFPWKKTQERAKEVLFPETPIMDSKEYVYYLKSSFPKGIDATKIENLLPYKMTGVLAYWYEKPAKKAGVDMHLVQNAEMAWMMLMLGKKEAYIENELVAKHDIKTFYPKEYQQFDHSKTPITQSDMFILFSKEHPDAKKIMEKIDAELKKMKDQGVIEAILNR